MGVRPPGHRRLKPRPLFRPPQKRHAAQTPLEDDHRRPVAGRAPRLSARHRPGRCRPGEVARRHHQLRRRQHAVLQVAGPAGRQRTPGRGRRRRRAGGDVDHLGLRRHLDEPRRHAHEPAVARADRRQHRDGRAWPRLRRAGRLCRLRQDPARHPDGDGPAQRAVGVRLWRLDAAGPLAGRPGKHRADGHRGRRAPADRRDLAGAIARHRAHLRDDRGFLPRPVHRQHHGDGRRDDRPVLPRLGHHPGGLQRALRAGPPRRPPRDGDAAHRRPAAARSRHPQEPGERLRRRGGHRRLHQCRAAHPGHRARGRHPLHARRRGRGLQSHAADRRPAAGRPLPGARPQRDRRRAGGAQRLAQGRLPPRRRADAVGAARWPRRWPTSPAPTAASCATATRPSIPRAAWSC